MIQSRAEFDKHSAEQQAQQSQQFASNHMSREAFDKRLDEVAAGAGPPRADYAYAKISMSLGDGGAIEDGQVHYFKSGFDLPIYRVMVDASGHVTETQAMPGASIYQTLKGITPQGHHSDQLSYAYGPRGRYVDRARIFDESGTLRADYRFNSDGIATQGETFGEDGHRTGAFSGP